jgi:hypothetical protein
VNETTPLPDPVTEASLRSLKDIALPPPVSWFPQTWGWLVLALILLLAVLLIFLRWLKHYRADRYRREALGDVAELERDIRNPVTRSQAIRSLAEILKRVALAAWPRNEVASLSGEAWTRFIRDRSGGKSGDTLQKMLNDLEYRSDESISALPPDFAEDLIVAARQWIGGHHVSA